MSSIPTSGKITLSQVSDIFGGTKMSEYYRGIRIPAEIRVPTTGSCYGTQPDPQNPSPDNLASYSINGISWTIWFWGYYTYGHNSSDKVKVYGDWTFYAVTHVSNGYQGSNHKVHSLYGIYQSNKNVPSDGELRMSKLRGATSKGPVQDRANANSRISWPSVG